VFAHSPSALRAYVALDKLVTDSGLSPAERRIVLLTASFENRCEYCMAAHSTGADKAGLDEETLEALREGRQIKSNDRFEALRSFTCKVVRQRGRLTDSDVREFLETDFSEGNILDVILIVAMKVLSNYTNHVAETPLDRRFEKTRWEPAQTRGAPRRVDDVSGADSAARH
jgi:uncharacterized peroxidase-related enzyme